MKVSQKVFWCNKVTNLKKHKTGFLTFLQSPAASTVFQTTFISHLHLPTSASKLWVTAVISILAP